MKRTSTRRSMRLSDVIMRRVAELLAEEIQDPRLNLVTISGVAMNADLRLAEVSYTVSGDQQRRDEVQAALDSAKGFLRQGLRPLKLQFIPDLRFRYDAYLEEMIYAHPGGPDNQDS